MSHAPRQGTTRLATQLKEVTQPMAKTRICFIGGGSYNWMPKLLGDLALTPDLEGTVVLHDLSQPAMDDIQAYGRKAIASTNANFDIETTTSLEQALDGAEF